MNSSSKCTTCSTVKWAEGSSIASRDFVLLQQEGMLRPCELDAYQYASTAPKQAFAAHTELSEKQTIVKTGKRIPKDMIFLLSALVIHEIITQSPFEVWIAIDRKARLPQLNDLPTHIVRFSGDALPCGVEHHEIDGARIPQMIRPDFNILPY